MKPSITQQQIIEKYLIELDKHIADLKLGEAEKTFEI